jgi:hypothetical protein
MTMTAAITLRYNYFFKSKYNYFLYLPIGVKSFMLFLFQNVVIKKKKTD